MTRRERRLTLIAAGLLFLAPLVVYWRLVAPGDLRRYFPGGDFVDQFYAFAQFEVARLASGHLPLWNPYAYGGGPFWADIQAAVAYPPSLVNALVNAVFLRHMSFAALEIEAVLHLGLAGVFTLLFARRWLGSLPGAVVAAAVFAFSGFLTGYPPLQLALLETIVWLPLALLGVELMAPAEAPEPAAPAGVPVLATALACAVLAGHPQSALHLLYVTAAYALWRLTPWREGRRGLLRPLGLAVALALLASAAGWLPAAELLRLSNRAAIDYAAVAHGFAPRELAGLLVPGLTHWSPLYVGLAALLLAAGAVAGWLASDASAPRLLRFVPFWAALAVVALLVALGDAGPVFDGLYLVAPGWDMFRGQERAAGIVAFSLANLAGCGAALWLAGNERVRRTVLVGAPTVAVVLVLVLVGARPELQPALVRGLVAATGLALLAAWARPPVRPGPFLAGVLALIALDLVGSVAYVNLVAERPAELAVTPVTAVLQEALPERVQNDDRLPPNFGVLHALQATSGASPLWLRSFATLRDGLKPTAEARLWDLLAVSHVITWREELPRPARVLITSGEGDDVARVFQLELRPQRVWRVSAAEVMTDTAAVARLAAPDFDPLSTVLLAEGEAATHPAGDAGLAITASTPGRLAARTAGDAPAWLVFAEVDYPGWRARLDGSDVPILRADVALMAVALPAGAHDVVLEFAPRIVGWGILLSAAGWLLIGIVAWRQARASRANSSTNAAAISTPAK